MSDDFEKRAEGMWANRGVEFSPETARKEFVLSGPDRRAQALDDLDKAIDDTGELSEGTGACRTASDRIALRRDLRALHHRMLSVKR
jgi:hypothetical protein